MSEKIKKLLPYALVFLLAIILIIFIVSDVPTFEKSTVAMGTVVTVKVYSRDAETHVDNIINIINELENEISRNIDTSAVSELNKQGTVKSSTVANAINAADRLSRKSEGRFDVTVGEISSLWDFNGDPKVPKYSDISDALTAVGYKNVTVNGDTVSISDGQTVDLGALGKGYACDKVMEYLKNSNVKGAVVSVGGSILLYGERDGKDEWNVAVKNSTADDSFAGVVTTKEAFVSTSGDYELCFEEDGKKYHHILDATTGYPAESDLSSVTVVCDNGMDSDILSTVCFILGGEKGEALIKDEGAMAVFIYSDGSIKTVGDIAFKEQR